MSEMGSIGEAVGELYRSYIDSGFSEEQAMTLARDFQKSMVETMLQPTVSQVELINRGIEKFLEEK